MSVEELEQDFRMAQLIRLGIVKACTTTKIDPKTGKEVVVQHLHFPVGLHVVED